jgi:hypothetical protein
MTARKKNSELTPSADGQALPASACSAIIGRQVIAPTASKYVRHGYKGRGYLGTVIEETESHAVVSFCGGGRRRFHKSHLSLLKPNSKDQSSPRD